MSIAFSFGRLIILTIPSETFSTLFDGSLQLQQVDKRAGLHFIGSVGGSFDSRDVFRTLCCAKLSTLGQRIVYQVLCTHESMIT